MNLNNLFLKFKAVKIHKYLRKILNPLTDSVLLIFITIIAYICLLYFLKYWWILFTSTPVGQAYAEHFSYSYLITENVLSTNLLKLAMKCTVTSFIVSLIIASICQFFLINKYFYSNRGLIVRIGFFGLPLAYIVAICMRYIFDFGHMSTAFTFTVIPTLCVFAGAFRIVEENVPELGDVILLFRGQHGKASTGLKDEEIQHSADELLQKKNPKKNGTRRQSTLKNIWESFAAYIIIVLIIILVAGTLLKISQIQNSNKSKEPAKAEAPRDIQPVAQPETPGPSVAVSDPAKEWYDKALVLHDNANRSDILKAIGYLSEAIRLKPDYVDAYRERGSFYTKMEHYELAINDYFEVIRLKPNDGSAYSMRGHAYLAQDNISLGCSDARKACALGNCNLLKKADYCRR